MSGLIANGPASTIHRLETTRWRWILPCLAALLSLTIAWYTAGGQQLALHIPLLYSTDGIFTLTLIKRLMENSWLFHSNAMGYPFNSSLYDYPIPDSGSFLALKAFATITHSAAAAYNIYYLIGFPASALTAYLALSRFGISRIYCFAGALTYSILPFHFLRIGHLLYTWYFVVPIFFIYAHQIYLGEPIFSEGKSRLGRAAFHIAALAFVSCFGVYYAFFGALMLLTAGLAGAVRQQSMKPMFASIAATAIISLTIGANVAPNVAYRITHGTNPEAVRRVPVEAELYGLKIAQIFLPRPSHRFDAFAKLNYKYNTTFPLVNENWSASEGFIGSAGLIILLFVGAMPRGRVRNSNELSILASLTLVLILFCTIGGFSTLFNALITPMIRAWNRASIFIAFASICASMLVVSRLTTHRRIPPSISGLIAASIVGFAYWDQTAAPCTTCIADVKTEFDNDAQFVSAIEKTLPAGSAIYQLPYMSFPEAPALYRMESYDLARGYLHSASLKWSYGSMKGRSGDLYFRALAQEPLQRQLDVIRRLGFGGLYLDRRGYADNGATVEAALRTALGPPTLVSSNGQQVFFDLRGPGRQEMPRLPVGLTDRQIMERSGFIADALGARYTTTLSDGIDFTRREVPTFLANVQGLSPAESWGRWSDANVYPYVKLTFTERLPKRFVLHLEAQGFGPNAGSAVKVSVGKQTLTFTPTVTMHEFSLPFENVDDRDIIEIRPAQPTSPSELGASADPRKLGVGLKRMWLSVQND